MLQTLYTECMLHTTAYRFPGILRWFEVIETDVVGSFFLLVFLQEGQSKVYQAVIEGLTRIVLDHWLYTASSCHG